MVTLHGTIGSLYLFYSAVLTRCVNFDSLVLATYGSQLSAFSPYQRLSRCISYFPQRSQVGFVGGGDAETLEGFLDGLAADPVGEAALVHVGLGGGPLLGQRGGEKPGLHHAHIVLLAVDGGDPSQILLGEHIGFQVVTHQHPDAETAGVLVAGGHPTAHLRQQLRPVAAKNAGR